MEKSIKEINDKLINLKDDMIALMSERIAYLEGEVAAKNEIIVALLKNV